MGLPFSKMHGAGNDFVVIDRRQASGTLPSTLVARLCDRHFGIGCDQLLTVEPPRSAGSVFAYGIWNQDGSAAAQCGNGARCVVAWARRAGLFAGDRVFADSPSGRIEAVLHADGIEIDMGRPDFSHAAVGFRDDGRGVGIEFDGRNWSFSPVSMGNPHAVIVVPATDAAPVQRLGPALQADPRFADSCNVGFAEVVDRQRVKLRVYERGVGETLACGSGACAAVAALRRLDRVDPEVEVSLPGGRLQILWPDPDGPMRMRGPAEFVFEGEFHP